MSTQGNWNFGWPVAAAVIAVVGGVLTLAAMDKLPSEMFGVRWANSSPSPSPLPSPSQAAPSQATLSPVVTQASDNQNSTVGDQTNNQGTFNAEAISERINKGPILFTSTDGNTFRGQITTSEIRKRVKPEESGVAAGINWNDGVKSSILFMENARVRVWSENVEYGGSWSWNSNKLYVNMDNGSRYQFGE